MLVELMIAQACVGLTGSYHGACMKAAEATAVQLQMERDVGNVERRTTEIAEAGVASVTGPEVVAVVVFAAKTAGEKQISAVVARENGNMPTVTATAKMGSGRITFGWSF